MMSKTMFSSKSCLCWQDKIWRWRGDHGSLPSISLQPKLLSKQRILLKTLPLPFPSIQFSLSKQGLIVCRLIDMADVKEKSWMEDKEKAKGLVDYSSSSDDENSAQLCDTGLGTDDYMSGSADENSALQPAVNMGCGKGPRSDGHLSDDADDLEEDRRMESFWNSEPFFSDTTSEGSNDDDCYTNYDNCYTDNDILMQRPYNWRAVLKWNLPEVYIVYVRGKSPLKRGKCLKSLNEIDCCDRYLGRSVESCRAFFANLRQDEAAKMEDVKGVHHVIPRRLSCYDIA